MLIKIKLFLIRLFECKYYGKCDCWNEGCYRSAYMCGQRTYQDKKNK